LKPCIENCGQTAGDVVINLVETAGLVESTGTFHQAYFPPGLQVTFPAREHHHPLTGTKL